MQNLNVKPKEVNIIISFLGNSRYTKVMYKFSDNKQFESNYTAVAFKHYLETKKINVTRFVIFGTEESSWIDYINKAYKIFSNTNKAKLKDPKYFEGLTSNLSPKEVITPELLKSLEDSINECIKKSCENFEFSFELHDTNIASMDLDSSYSRIFKKISSYKDFSEKTNLYLDITNGFRLMPMLAFFAIESFALLNKEVTLKTIFYGQVTDKSVGTKIGPDRSLFEKANSLVSNVLGAARSSDTTKFKALHDKAMEILKDVDVQSPKDVQKNNVYDVCTLQCCDDIFKQAMNISCYDVSAEVNVFKDYLDKTSTQCVEDISIREDFVKNNDARDFAKDLNKIVYKNHVIGGINDRLNLHIDILKHPDQLKSLKALAVLQFEKHNYFRAINTIVSLIEEEVCNANPTLIKVNEKKGAIRTHLIKYYGTKFYNMYVNIVNIHRAILVHMNDKEESLEKDEAKLTQLLKNDNFYNSLKEFMIDFGCEFNKSQNSINNKDNVFISFIGSGSYEIMDYSFSTKASDLTLKNVAFLGNALAAKLLHDNKINRYVIVGSETSDWMLFFRELELAKEFANNITLKNIAHKASEILDDGIYQKMMKGDTKDTIAKLFEDNKLEIGFTLELLVLKQKLITEDDTFYFYKQIENSLKNANRIYLDMTHGFRSMPMATYTSLAALRESYNLKIADIYYGVLNDDLCDKTVVENKFVREINSLKRKIVAVASYSDKEKASNCLLKLSELFNSYQPLNGKGTILKMNVLDNLTKNSMALAKYTKDSNLEHLIPLFEDNNLLQKEKLIMYIKRGALCDNLSFTNKYMNDLQEFAKLYEQLKDALPPILKLISHELDSRLDFLYFYETTNDKIKRVKYLLKKAQNAMPDTYKSSCYLYETLQSLAYYIRNQVFMAFTSVCKNHGQEFLKIRKTIGSSENYLINECASSLKSSNVLCAKDDQSQQKFLKKFANDPKIDNKKDNPLANSNIIRDFYIMFPNINKCWQDLKEIRNMMHYTKNYNDTLTKNYAEILEKYTKIIEDDNNYL